MPRTNRRQFLRSTGASLSAIGAGFAISGTRSSGRIVGANDTLNVAVAGLNGRGGAHVGGFAGRPGVRVTALVDPDSNTFAKRVAAAESKPNNGTPRTFDDVRRVLDDPGIDILSIATPNHWHALMTVWACQAGKDVYVEKPCSHDIHEGRSAVKAARKYQRVVQHGTQGRSDPRWAQVAEIARAGKLGKLLVSRALCYKLRDSIGTKPDGLPPTGLDYNQWLGPAAESPYNPNYVHYNWHWFWNFGNGDIGNQGVHQFDIARWVIPGATLPDRVQCLGGRFGYTDQGETPNTQVAVLHFGETPLVFEVRGLKSRPFHGETVGNILHFEGGVVTGKAFFPTGSDKPAPLPEVEWKPRPGGNDHFGNFLEAVRGRDSGLLNAEIEQGHYSSALCHLANIAYRVGEPNQYFRTRAGDDRSSYNEAIERMLDHLEKDHNLSGGQLAFRISPTLQFDRESEKFTGDLASEANALLGRQARTPFLMPEGIG